MVAMLDGRNKEIFLYENRFHFPEKRNCIVPAIQHGCHANPLLSKRWFCCKKRDENEAGIDVIFIEIPSAEYFSGPIIGHAINTRLLIDRVVKANSVEEKLIKKEWRLVTPLLLIEFCVLFPRVHTS